MSLARWSCPTCKSGALAPRRPRKDDVRRYCLRCSKETGRLVERVCGALEKQRAERKARASASRRKAYVFRAPDGYYLIGGVDVAKLWAGWIFKSLGHRCVRVRTTTKAGPAHATARRLTLRRGPWADAYDAQAQVVVGTARTHLVNLGHSKPTVIRGFIRHLVEQMLKVRPRLEHLSQAEIEVAALLRAQAAAAKLGQDDGRMGRVA